MNLGEYLTPEKVVVLQSPDKRAALEALVDVLAPGAEGVTRDEVSEAIWRREGLMSTGIGHGLAVPHVRMAGLSRPAVAAGVFPAGVTGYESLDSEPVRIVVMIAAPQGAHETYIRLLAEVVEALKQPELRQRIVAEGDPLLTRQLLTSGQVPQEATP